MIIITTDEITEIFCIVDDFCKNFQPEMEKLQKLPERKIWSISIGRKNSSGYTVRLSGTSFRRKSFLTTHYCGAISKKLILFSQKMIVN
jgi:hypothetical protein